MKVRHGRALIRSVGPVKLVGSFGSLVLLLTAAYLFAQPPTRLDPLVVTARTETAESPLGTTTSLPPPVGPRLVETLASVPGLIVQDSFGGFEPPRLGVRGSGIQSAPTSRGLVVSQFGLPLNAADGSFNLSLLENNWLGSASLTRGSGAGVPALGGALDFSPDVFLPGRKISASYGSYDTISLDGRGLWNSGDLTIAGRAAWFRSDGWRPHSAQERETILAAARAKLDADTDLTVSFFGSTPWYEVPGPMTYTQALNDPTAVLPMIERDRPRRDTRHAHLNATATRRLNENTFSAALGVTATDDTFHQLLPNGISTTDAWDCYLSLLAGYEWSETQRSRVQALFLTGWWDALRHRNLNGEKSTLIGDQELRPFTLTAALDHQIRIAENHRLDFGLSLLAARRDVDDSLRFEGVAQDLDFSGSRLAPRLAWSWDVASDITLIAAASRSYEPPTYGDLLYTAGPPNSRVLRVTSLDWQRADTLELGCTGRAGTVSWSAFVYHAWWCDELLRLADSTGASLGTVNAGDTIHRGFEAGLNWEFLRHAGITLSLDAVYNFAEARFDGDPVYGDRRLGGVPPHSGRLALTAAHDDGWFISPACDFRGGSTYADHAGDLSYGGTALFSLELGRRQTDGWSAILAIDNLFDRAAIASSAGVLERAANPAATSIILPATGRTISLRLEYTW